MSKLLSAYLDVLRFGAAILVLLYHLDSAVFGTWLWQIRSYGPQGVVIFFVMSGYVIAYTANTKNRTLDSYAVARFARLYSVMAPAIVFTVAVDLIVRYAAPNFYHAQAGSSVLGAAIANLTFTSQLWFVDNVPWCNTPLWSLGYEFWFYVIFAGAVYFRGQAKWIAIAVTSLIAGPRILLLMPLWLFGVVAYKLATRLTMPPLVSGLLFISTGAAAVYFVIAPHALTIGGPLLHHHFKLFIPLALVVAMNIFSVATMQSARAVLHRPIQYAAGATFTIYLFHQPIQTLISAALNGTQPSPIRSTIIGIGLLGMLFLIAEFTERRKQMWTRLFSQYSKTSSGAMAH